MINAMCAVVLFACMACASSSFDVSVDRNVEGPSRDVVSVKQTLSNDQGQTRKAWQSYATDDVLLATRGNQLMRRVLRPPPLKRSVTSDHSHTLQDLTKQKSKLKILRFGKRSFVVIM